MFFQNKRLIRYKIYELFGYFAVMFNVKPKALVFIIGTGRCGSTMFQKILNTGKSINVFPGEANEYFHPESYPFTNKLSIIQDPKRFSNISLNQWEKNAKKIHKLLTGYAFLKGNNKPLIVKSAMITFLAKQLSETYPDAKFIHLYRHAIPVINSIEKKEWIKHKDIVKDKSEFRKNAARYWNDCIQYTAEFQKELPQQKYFELSYEWLCENCSVAMSDIAEFIGVNNQFYCEKIEIDTNKSEIGNLKANEDKCFPIVKEGLLLKGYIAK